MKGLSNEAAPIINKFILDDIPRCIECNLISSLNCSLFLNLLIYQIVPIPLINGLF